MHNSLGPFFRAFIKNSPQAADISTGTGVTAVSQKISDLELSLYNLKQNVQIDSVKLNIHPVIQIAAKQSSEGGRTLKPEDLGEAKLKDEDFLQNLQSAVNIWIRDIQKITKLERIEKAPTTGETIQEIKFWLELEVELKHIDEQLKTPEAECTLAVLRQAKRFITTAAFDTDTIGLKKAMEKVNSYKTLMKDFPINDLLTAIEVDKLPNVVTQIFSHMKKNYRNSAYPVDRYLRLIEAISRDLSVKILAILQRKRLMTLEYDEFDRITNDTRKVFIIWEEQFREILRELAKKRSQEKVPLRVNVDNKVLQDRIASIRKFRRQHNELKSVIVRVLPNTGGSEIDSIKEINEAFEEIKSKEVLSLSKDGTDLWEAALKRYDSRIDRVETQITSILRDKLATAKNANEMFRVFSKFNALFVRPRIKGAIQEYQAQLIQRVKQDITALHEKFKMRYTTSEAYKMSNLHDLPPVSGAIIWARQLERQLNTYLQRVEDVLGKGWELDIEGKKLKEDGESFRKT